MMASKRKTDEAEAPQTSNAEPMTYESRTLPNPRDQMARERFLAEHPELADTDTSKES